MSEFQDSIYLLRNNLDRSLYVKRGEGEDLQAFSFDGVVQVRHAIQDKILGLPTPTFFYQCHEDSTYVSKLDSLETLEGCPIFSRRMIDTLLSIRDFRHRIYPIAVLKERGNLEPYKDVQKFNKSSLRDDLFIFQTLEFLDIFDWDNSEYTQEDYDEEMNIPTYIDRFVLKTPDDGFPPLFRLPFKMTNHFISREAREALKKEGIIGPAFTPLSRPGGNSEVDVPINVQRSVELIHEADKHQRRIDRVFTRAEEERAKGNDSLADRLEQEAHDLMRMSG
jgi:hypothetical protein